MQAFSFGLILWLSNTFTVWNLWWTWTFWITLSQDPKSKVLGTKGAKLDICIMICKQRAILGCKKFHTFEKMFKNSNKLISSLIKMDGISIKSSWGLFTISSLGWISHVFLWTMKMKIIQQNRNITFKLECNYFLFHTPFQRTFNSLCSKFEP